MKFIKLGLISIVVLFGLITFISSLLPSHIRISRAIDIDATKEKIYVQIANIKQWQLWNVYIMSYTGTVIGKDTLQSKNMLVHITERTDSLVKMVWHPPFSKSFESGYQIVSQTGDHCTVQWYFDFTLKWYPWEKFQSIVYDQQFGPVMEQSLNNLKKEVEKSL